MPHILDHVIKEHNPRKVFALFSGGHDSLCSTHVASSHPRFDGVIHINTGIGIEDTREFVRETCKKFDWPLKEYHPPVSYEEIIKKYGFPGPGGHNLVYQRLKERCLRQVIRESKQKWKDRIIFVTGVRKSESVRRMGHVEEIQRRGATVWTAVIADWTDTMKNWYMDRHNLPRNPVVENLCMSGECLCGAFAKPDELETIRYFYPDAATEIDRLSKLAEKAGVPSKWGCRPGKRRGSVKSNPLCWSCESAMLEERGII